MGNSTSRAKRRNGRRTKKRTMRSKHMKRKTNVGKRKNKTKRRTRGRRRKRTQRGGGVGYGFTGKGNEGFGGSYGNIETFSTCS